MRKYEKEFKSIPLQGLSTILEVNIKKSKFKNIGKVDMNNGMVIILEKYTLALACKLVSTIIINLHDEHTNVVIVTDGGKISEFLDLGINRNTHNDVINIVEESFINKKSSILRLNLRIKLY